MIDFAKAFQNIIDTCDYTCVVLRLSKLVHCFCYILKVVLEMVICVLVNSKIFSENFVLLVDLEKKFQVGSVLRMHFDSHF